MIKRKIKEGIEINSKRKGIVLNRMYVGDYLSDNIGHEVINLFKADNGKHYVYLNSRGNLAKEHKGKIGYMLFVKYHTKGEVEVIGKAVGLEEADGVTCSFSRKLGEKDIHLSGVQNEYITKKEGGIFYSKASILEIFEGAGQQNIYITYKAEAVYRIKKGKKIIIHFGEGVEEKKDVITLESYQQAKASLKQYIYPSANNEDYTKLLEIINNDDYWEKEVVCNVADEIKNIGSKLNVNRENSLFDICRIQNDENRFSDALKYFMGQRKPKYEELWKEFFYSVKTIEGKPLNIDIDFSTLCEVVREKSAQIEDVGWKHSNNPGGGRIDLYIRSNNNIIVIENKIKSDVNTVSTDTKEKNQLDRYVNYISWLISKTDVSITPHFVILTPDYNIPKLSDEMREKYKIVTYGGLYDFLESKKEVFKDDLNFVAFFEAMCRHTHKNVNDYLYYEMMEKFIHRINAVNESK